MKIIGKGPLFFQFQDILLKKIKPGLSRAIRFFLEKRKIYLSRFNLNRVTFLCQKTELVC